MTLAPARFLSADRAPAVSRARAHAADRACRGARCRRRARHRTCRQCCRRIVSLLDGDADRHRQPGSQRRRRRARFASSALLATLPYPIKVQPRIDDFATVHSTGRTVPLIGLDLVADHPDGLHAPSDEQADTERTSQHHVSRRQRLGQLESGSQGRRHAGTSDQRRGSALQGARRPEGFRRQRRPCADGHRRRAARRESHQPRRPRPADRSAAHLRWTNGSSASAPCCPPASSFAARAARPTRIAACSAPSAGTCAS